MPRANRRRERMMVALRHNVERLRRARLEQRFLDGALCWFAVYLDETAPVARRQEALRDTEVNLACLGRKAREALAAIFWRLGVDAAGWEYKRGRLRPRPLRRA